MARSAYRPPNIVVHYSIHDQAGRQVHSGHFKLSEHTDREVFARRSYDALRDGFEVRTVRRIEVNKRGVIVTPGLFKGTLKRDHYLWTEYLKACQPEVGQTPETIDITEEDINKFGELQGHSLYQVDYTEPTPKIKLEK